MIAEQLCPHCSIEEDGIPATEDARELQRDLGNLGATCKHLHAVANQHRYHSFVMPYDPSFHSRGGLTGWWDGLDEGWWDVLNEDIDLAQRFNNSALPALLDRIITHGKQGEQLRYLSITDFTLRFKAGVTKMRLRRFIISSLTLGIPIPRSIVSLLLLPEKTRKGPPPNRETAYWVEGQLWIIGLTPGSNLCAEFDAWMLRLLLFGTTPRLQKLMISPIMARRVFNTQYFSAASLPSVKTLGIPRSKEDPPFIDRFQWVQMESLLRCFPNLRAFQNDEISLGWTPYRRDPADAPPFFPNLRRLVLTSELPGRLHHLTEVLREFPQLEELYFQRRTSLFEGEVDPNFSNAGVFNGVHHCLQRLTYTAAYTYEILEFDVHGRPLITVLCQEEPRPSDVPHFRAFAILKDLTIDQSLLGRLSTIRDRMDSPTGPFFPDLDWQLPESLRRLTVRFVYNWPQLASQLTNVAIAKQRGQFPHLSDIFVVIVRGCTIEYDGVWPPQFPLLPSEDITRDAGELLRAAGINLWVSSGDIEAPRNYDNKEDYPHSIVPVGTVLAVETMSLSFHEF